jgi:hypothetical protein
MIDHQRMTDRKGVIGFFLFLFLSLVCPAGEAGVLEGRVVHGIDPVSGIKVSAYKSLDFTGEPLGTAATDAEGLYRLELPAGLYALFARDDGRGLFAFCGRNPVAVAEGRSWAGLQAVKMTPPQVAPYDDEYSGAIEGRVLFEGEPVAEARVYLYLDADTDLKGQGYRLSPPTGAQGRFSFEGLPESSYFLVARKRAGGGRVGPVREGDLQGVFHANPLYVKAGHLQQISIPMVTKMQQESGSETFVRATGMAVKGRAVNAEGAPLAGVHAFAYPDRVIGHQRPASLSLPTGEDGRFTLFFTEPGIYYIGAREEYGDSPMPGELFGMYDETADHGLEVVEGKTLRDVRIMVEPIRLE